MLSELHPLGCAPVPMSLCPPSSTSLSNLSMGPSSHEKQNKQTNRKTLYNCTTFTPACSFNLSSCCTGVRGGRGRSRYRRKRCKLSRMRMLKSKCMRIALINTPYMVEDIAVQPNTAEEKQPVPLHLLLKPVTLGYGYYSHFLR